MTISIAIAFTAIGALAPNAFHFQSEVVPYQDMSKGHMATELMQLTATGSAAMHVVVRFDTPVDSNTRTLLQERGLSVQYPLGGAAYVAVLDPQLLDPRNMLALDHIRELRPLEPMWKLHSFLADGRIPTWTMPTPTSRVAQADPIVALYVMFHEDVDLQLCELDMVQVFGGKVRSTLSTSNTVIVELPYSQIDFLIEDDRVLYVEPALPKFSELNNSNRSVTQADIAQSTPYDLDGEGVSVMVYDGGYGYSGHGDFGGRHYTRDSAGLSNHATHVAGTIGGDGSGSGGQYRGMAPAVTIQSYGFEQEGGLEEGFLYTDPGDLEQDYSQAINTYGAVLANNSIGTNTAPNGFPCEWTGNYGITSNLIDSVVRGDLGGDIRIVWANGNERGSSNCGTSYNSTAPPACAKNHITVGAFNSNDESMTYFSSWGPTDDGRIKPDISAPGCESGGDGGVTSCSSSGGYTSMCGTSMACPTVTGLSALIVQDWRTQHPGEPDLMNSTLKALLAHTAEDKFNTGPDCQYGYGSVRVVDAIDHLRADNIAELEISQGETVEMLIFAEQPGMIKATIAWDDVPATPLVIPSLVNDIDIVVVDPNGTTHYPWTIDPANPVNPAVRTQADHLNNIEQVQIDAGVSGVYRIIITGYNIAVGSQQFGLMASPALIQCSPSGIASLDRSSYACGAMVGLQVVDCDLNTDDNVIDITTVTVSSTSGDATDVTLVETGVATSSFMASIVIGEDVSAEEGDTLTITYIDANDGQGGSNVVVTDDANVDCTTPIIGSIVITEVMTHEATVSVTTNEDTAIRVYYGESCASLTNEASSNQMGTSHEIELNGLSDNTAYRFEVHAIDGAGNAVIDDNNGTCYLFVTEDVPSYFTEQDSGFDLDGMSVTFTPYTNVDQYRACAEPITSLPSDPNGGTTVSLSDDDAESRNTSQPVWLYGESYSTIYIGSNGQLTFNSGSTDYTESISEHFALIGISMLWDDLNPASGGTIRFSEYNDRSVVTFNNVPEYSNTGSNTFQCELFYDGVIRLSWLGVDSNDNIVGLSAGGGTPLDFEEDDISSADDCGDPVVQGDVNGDGIVDVADLLAIMDAWGPCDGCPADLNSDGIVDVVDLLEVVGNWG
ncbi:MAG: S8 family serine peptidase [Planctomycetes bacterium]|nr:S8 family serine peptidase [Planctomycetota bacterium]